MELKFRAINISKYLWYNLPNMGITHKQRGFTIIEVSLFVAVAGLLLAGVMTGITAAVNQQRFHDTINSTQNILQQQFSEVQFVSNNSSTGCGADSTGSTKCAIIGKLIDLGASGGAGDGSVITSYDIIVDSDLPPADQLASETTIEVLNKGNVRVVDNSNKQASPVAWGGIIQKKDSGDYNRYLGIIQSPITGDISIYAINISSSNDDSKEGIKSALFDGNGILKINTGEIQATYTPTPVCIISQDILSLKGTLSVAQGGSPDAVTVDFKGEDC